MESLRIRIPKPTPHKPYKSELITKEYEKRHYDEWMKTTQRAEREVFGAIHWFVGHVFPMLLATYFLVATNTLTFTQHFILISVTLWFYPFTFVSAHALLHIQMLQEYNNGIIEKHWTYYHHYVDVTVLSKFPYGYRNSYLYALFLLNATWIGFAMFGFYPEHIGFNVQIYMAAAKAVMMYTDFVLHEWYHTFDSKYTVKWNIFSSKFIGVHMFYQALQYFGFADKEMHRGHHDPSSSAQQEETKEWVDLNVVHSAGWLAEKYGAWLFAGYKWIHHHMLHRAMSSMYDAFFAVQIVALEYIVLCVVSCLLGLTDSAEFTIDESSRYVDIRINIILVNAVILIFSELYFYLKRSS